jgi:RHS repeat-associated protein
MLLLLFSASASKSQTSSATDGSTPLGLSPGAPAGSYALSGFENVNPYNGNLNFHMPLRGVEGRGDANTTSMLTIDAKSWSVKHRPVGDGESLDSPTQNWWAPKPGYGPGLLVGRQSGFGTWGCGFNGKRYIQTLTRLTFSTGDGTEYEFRDQLTGGQPATLSSPCSNPTPSRGTVFITADGSAATFVSDATISDTPYILNETSSLIYPSGYLMLRDGKRLRIDGGNVTWIRDRNGNKLSFTYDTNHRVLTITDSLNRQVTFSYADFVSTFSDQITFKGFSGLTRSISINYSSLSNALRTTNPRNEPVSRYQIQTYKGLFPLLNNASNTTSFNPQVVSSLTLPNGQQYQFRYNCYAELARVNLPTGGAVEYDYTAGSGANSDYIYRRVIERRVYPDGTNLEGYTTFSDLISGVATVDQLNPGGTLLARAKHYFYGNPINSFYASGISYPAKFDGREYKSESYSSDGVTLLRSAQMTWANRAPITWSWSQCCTDEPPNDPRITDMTTTLADVSPNLVAKQVFGYDDSVPFNNKNNVKEYAFGSGGPGALVRETRTTFLTATNYIDASMGAHLRSLPSLVSIYDAGGVERARTTFEYDNYTSDTNHAALTDCSSISGLDSGFTTGYLIRGNATGVTRYLLTNGSVTGSISAYSQFDIAGNVVKTIDGRGYATRFEYNDRYGAPDGEAQSNTAPSQLSGLTSYAFPTKIINALNQFTLGQFDYYLGRAVDVQDLNGIVSSGYFNDGIDRPTQVRRAVGTTVASQITFNYDETNRIITTTSDLNSYNDNVLTSKLLYDGLGRTIETREYEGGTNYIATQQQYDALGRVFRSSSPFRPWQGETAVWTTQAFDALGRVTSVTTPDNAVVSTGYIGNSVTVTDQVGKAKKSVTDALGRLIEVYEDPNGVNWQTTYSYDVLDGLVKVTQGAQQRFFMYDSLKRLIRARNPELNTLSSLNLSDPITGNSSWSYAYQYDANGNLSQKTDTRGVTSTYTYDALNRNTLADYSDTTPDVSRQYDLATNGIGRVNQISQAGTQTSATYTDSYDALGRPLVQRQRFQTAGVWSSSYQITSGYNLAGGVTSQTYPSGHTVSYSYDAAGRSSSFSGNLGDGASRTYASNSAYSPFGGLSWEQFGTNTPLYHKSFYNIRGQLFDTRLSSVNDTWDWNRGRLIFYYSSNHQWGQSGTDNNGNVRFAETWIPPNNATLDQADTLIEDSYNYDALNRLASVSEQRMSVSNGWVWQSQFAQVYGYDRYGNRTIDAGQTWGTGINNKQFTVDPNNTNRLLVPAGQSGVMTYDAVGNLINDTYTSFGSRVYDAENKMTSAQDSYAGWSYYSYDGNGQRVRRKVNNQETWQIYGMEGELLAEYAANAATTNPQKEYGYRNGQLLITAEPPAAQQGTQNVSWTSAVGVSVSTNSLTKTAADGWGNGGAASSQAIVSGDGYVEMTITETNKDRFFGLSDSETTPSYDDIDFSVRAYSNGVVYCYEPGTNGAFCGYYAPGYKLRVAIEGGVVKYYMINGATTTLMYTATHAPTYPMRADAAIYDNAGTVTNAVISGNLSGGSGGSGTGGIHWLVTDHLGTPRMIVDQTGAWSNVKRHDYLPFGEELYAGTGGRTVALGYSGGDAVRQQFTSKERDNETGLDYFGARYYASTQGRFTSPDPLQSSGRQIYPQSWNRYSYVMNHPLSLIDPDGLDWGVATWYDPRDKVWRTDYHYFSGEVGSWEGHTYKSVDFRGDATRTLDLSDGRTICIANDPKANGGEYMRDVTSHAKVEQEPVLAPSWVDYVPIASTGRKFLFHFTTHQFEAAMLDFSLMSAELGTANVAASAGAAKSFATGSGEAIFYSGGRGSLQLATQAARTEGGKLITDTLGGRALNFLTKPLPPRIADPFWKWGSKHFAEGASGTIRTFIREPLRNSSTWRQVEYPILRVNPFVRIMPQ